MTPSSGESIGLAALRINASVPSEPLIDVCLARRPKGETNPLSARSHSSETKFVAKIGVGLLPFISTASVWQKGRPVDTSIDRSGMFFEDFSDLLHSGPSSLESIHF